MKDIKAVAFDLDGTIYLGNEPLEGALSLIDFLKTKAIQPLYFTNNSTRTREEIWQKLVGMGFVPELSDVYTSAFAAALYTQEIGVDRVFCIGSSGLREELIQHSVTVTDDAAVASCLVVGLDLGFDFSSPPAEVRRIPQEARFIACNMDMSYPGVGGKLMPGCGRIVKAVSSYMNRQPDYIVGKPNTYMIKKLAEDRGLSRNDILVVGDTYDSDIEMALRYGCRAVFIGMKENTEEASVSVVNNLGGIERLLSE